MAKLYLQLDHKGVIPGEGDDCFKCSSCGRLHENVYTIYRKAVTTIGHYVVFRIGGKTVPYDPTLPHRIGKLPRDARKIDQPLVEKMWHSHSHYFGEVDDDV